MTDTDIGKSPGQAAYEAWPNATRWEHLRRKGAKAEWEAVAEAAIDASGLRKQLAAVTAERDRLETGLEDAASEVIREARSRSAARADLEDARAQLAEVTAERNKAYRERAELVAFVVACYPSEIRDTAEDWPVVFVDTPRGQLSWHLSRDDLDLFGHVPQMAASAEEKWDGHTTEQKYDRLNGLATNRKTGIAGENARYADMLHRIANGTVPAAGAAQAAYDVLDGATPGPESFAVLELDLKQLREAVTALADKWEQTAYEQYRPMLDGCAGELRKLVSPGE